MQASKRPVDSLTNRDGERLHETLLAPHQEEDFKAARLAFVGVMLRELRELSIGVREPMLVYLIEMAALEADEAIRIHKNQSELA